MMTCIYLVRHGETALNDPKHECLRGWSDIPLDPNGHEAAKEAGERLAGEEYLHKLLASDLQRTMLTASLIADKIQLNVQPNRDLRPWNLGDLTGKPIKEILPRLERLQEFKDLKAPNGESYNDFLSRWSAALKRMMSWTEQHPEKRIVAVTHSRNLLSIPYILSHGKAVIPPKGGPKPGEIILLVLHESGSWKLEKFHHGDSDY